MICLHDNFYYGVNDSIIYNEDYFRVRSYIQKDIDTVLSIEAACRGVVSAAR